MIIVIIGICSIFNTAINNARQVSFNRINTLYDSIELYIIKNDIVVDGKMGSFLRGMKTFVVNNEFADIHILLVTRQSMTKEVFEKKKAEYNKIISELPEGFITLKKAFDHEINRAVFFSVFRWEFLAFFIYLITKNTFKAAVEKSGHKIKLVFQMIGDLFKYENIVVSKYAHAQC